MDSLTSHDQIPSKLTHISDSWSLGQFPMLKNRPFGHHWDKSRIFGFQGFFSNPKSASLPQSPKPPQPQRLREHKKKQTISTYIRNTPTRHRSIFEPSVILNSPHTYQKHNNRKCFQEPPVLSLADFLPNLSSVQPSPQLPASSHPSSRNQQGGIIMRRFLTVR